MTYSKLEMHLGLDLKSQDSQPIAHYLSSICCIFHLLLKDDGTVKIQGWLQGAMVSSQQMDKVGDAILMLEG